MLRWEEARQQGRELSAEELCADCPQLAAELRRRMHAVLAMEQTPGVGFTERGGGAPAAARESAEHEPLPVIPGYEIIRVIDRGGMGVVYEARQTALGRTVAIKMVSGAYLRPKVIARFRLEAEA